MAGCDAMLEHHHCLHLLKALMQNCISTSFSVVVVLQAVLEVRLLYRFCCRVRHLLLWALALILGSLLSPLLFGYVVLEIDGYDVL